MEVYIADESVDVQYPKPLPSTMICRLRARASLPCRRRSDQNRNLPPAPRAVCRPVDEGPFRGNRSNLGSPGDHLHVHALLSAQKEDIGQGVRALICCTREAKVDNPGMGTGSDREHRVHRRIGNIWGGKIMTKKGTSSSLLFHSSKGSGHLAPPFPQIQVSQDSKNSLQEKNIDDILEQREWKVRNVGNWLDGEREEFFRDYNDLPLPPTKEPQLRERKPAQHPPLRKPPTSPKFQKGGQYNREEKKRQME